MDIYYSVRYNIYQIKIKTEMSDKRTLQKCRKIMQMFQKQKPRPTASPHSKPTQKLKQRPISYNSTFNSNKKNQTSPNQKNVSFCLPSRSKQKNHLYSKNSLRPSFNANRSSSSIQSAKKSVHSFSAAKSGVGRSGSKDLGRGRDADHSRSKSKNQFTSIYGNQSRYDKIMKLKVKTQVKPREDNRGSYLNASKISYRSSASSLDRSTQTKQSRLDKIMKLKVHKPKVDSTLKNYQPPKQPRRQLSKNKENMNQNFFRSEFQPPENTILELKKCREKQKKEQRQSQKQDRLWKIFERQRQLRLKQKQKKQRVSYQRQRSLEKRFDYLVQKQLKRIQLQKELEERREQGFSTYLFPSY